MRARRITLTAATLSTLIAVAAPAYATSGIYTGLSFGYGAFSGSRLVITDDGQDHPLTDSNVCCPEPGIAMEFRLGFDIEKIIAPEFVFAGHGWDLGGETGGAGYIGGGLRVFPVGLIGLSGLDVTDFQEVISLSFGAALGYTLVGKDFAYSGSFFGIDATAEYMLTDVVSLGFRLTVMMPSYGDFAWSDYGDDRGRCLDPSGNQVDPLGLAGPKSSASCAGNGPNTTYISPQLSVTFHFDVID